ncbi:ABC transporter substrate-binding protein [Mesorhizobium sp. LHD-90]|uniref:ABC transporter substrate-binding protein n=1 Tax=Mesorhizobium sp. LHD-90 TaxID=3071414 RepID=UPI0027E19528|nr:ABC transporter substrate-binding protein [Mesorhizobium sp. LHD-90]MDQ6434106.1 ABC transporter substrate-binding protein [Mesorhizobium sp. LHD-90]
MKNVRNGLSRRSVLKLGAGSAAVSLLGMPAIGRAQTTSLSVANGGGALGDAFKAACFDTFEKKTGIKIISAPYIEGARLKAMVEAGAVDIDVADTDAAEAAPLAVEGLLEEIDYSVVPKDGLIEGSASKYWTACYIAGSVLSWNTEAAEKNGHPKTWQEFFDPSVKGRRTLWKNAAQTMEVAALGAGQPADKLYPLDLDRAFAMLDGIRSSITWWSSGAQSAQLLASNEADYGMCWNGRVDPIKQQGGPIDYTFEHALHMPGIWSLPKGGRNRDAAMQFVAHCMDPEVQAEFSRRIPYGPTATKAFDLLTAEERARMPSAPENSKTAVAINGDYWLEKGAEVYERFNTWVVSQ